MKTINQKQNPYFQFTPDSATRSQISKSFLFMSYYYSGAIKVTYPKSSGVTFSSPTQCVADQVGMFSVVTPTCITGFEANGDPYVII